MADSKYKYSAADTLLQSVSPNELFTLMKTENNLSSRDLSQIYRVEKLAEEKQIAELKRAFPGSTFLEKSFEKALFKLRSLKLTEDLKAKIPKGKSTNIYGSLTISTCTRISHKQEILRIKLLKVIMGICHLKVFWKKLFPKLLMYLQFICKTLFIFHFFSEHEAI